jgi:membrane-bound serine protease (ClpP class)
MIWLGIVLLVLAFGLIIGELFTGSGVLLVTGVAALIFGLIVLFTQGSVLAQISLWVLVPLIIAIIGTLTFVVLRVINTHYRKATTGKEDMEGSSAIVKEALNPQGTVFYKGELWNAMSSSGKILPGEEVIITRVEGLILMVRRKERE